MELITVAAMSEKNIQEVQYSLGKVLIKRWEKYATLHIDYIEKLRN